MAKIEHDKYYTPDDVALRLTRLTIEKLGRKNITEVIEPSVGGGAFQRAWKEATGEDMDWCGDLYPVEGVACEQADWIEKAGEMEYRAGRLVLGNPPFGHSGLLARAFYNAAVDVADYVAFILPVSQHNNTVSYYKFDLIHSEVLEGLTYTNENGESRVVHCCFNIYRRPVDGVLRKRRVYVFDGGDVGRYKRAGSKTLGDTPKFNPDLRLGAYGSGCAGRILEPGESFCQEWWIRFDRAEDEAVFRAFDWRSWANEKFAVRCGSQSITLQQVLEKMRDLGLPVSISESAASIKRREVLEFVDGDVGEYRRTGNKNGDKIPKFKTDVRLNGFGTPGRILCDGESVCREIWLRFDRKEDEAAFRAFDWCSWFVEKNAVRCGSPNITKHQLLSKMKELGFRVRQKDASTDPLF